MYNVVDKDDLWATDLPGIRKLINRLIVGPP